MRGLFKLAWNTLGEVLVLGVGGSAASVGNIWQYVMTGRGQDGRAENGRSDGGKDHLSEEGLGGQLLSGSGLGGSLDNVD